ncbi:alpha/beta fold hydrolase [Novosphingobium piscinae]|uniref:Alpha/beta hydrolase n=1 Tax=Novosphingobium piscinae TaxID=1507448 RepID=A0A7X1G1S2_9SPHN|nr:alpha/beta hydrolase [Novosphingobium piscinae]MBC2670412.1 alpha/beta hydrolase [Novosphingobium piscinae]
MTQFEDRYWSSRDGLRLHYRDYAAAGPEAAARPPVVCLPGLTRNARDFETLAARLAPRWRVLCPELRGRGDSAYAKDSATYQPLQYVDDIEALLAETGIARCVIVGTSLGGILTMLLAARGGERIAAAALNDIGPELDPAGLARILDYVGQGRSFPTWMHAARALHEAQGAAFPRFTITDWLAMAKRVMTLGQNGRIVFDYDMKIAEPFAATATAAPVDLWPAWEALAGRPLLVLRGALSDLFPAHCLDEMVRRVPGTEALTLPEVGHAPTLDEPEAVAAIERLLARVA